MALPVADLFIDEMDDTMGAALIADILGVHPRTLRRRATMEAKSVMQSQREEKLRAIWAELGKLYKPENAARWLKSEVPALGGRTPVSVMKEDGGLDRVLQTVGRMTWGIPG